MSLLAQALLDQLDDEALDALAQRLAPLVANRVATAAHPAAADRWLTTREAAAYIGRSPNALHKLSAARVVPFSQDGPGARCYFRRSDLDAWMASR